MSSNEPQILLKDAASRATEGTDRKLYEFDDFRLDERKRVFLLRQEPVPLTAKAFDTLLVLVKSEGQLVTKDSLMKTVWPDSFVEEANLTQTIFMLRKALGQTPDRVYIVTVPGRGYRFVPDVRQVSRDEPPVESKPAVLGPIEFLSRRHHFAFRRWQALVGMAALLLIAVGVYFRWSQGRRRAESHAERFMLAVLPFQNLTGDPGQDYFSDGMTEEMISQLGELDPTHLSVIARTSVMHYKNAQTPLNQIGRELGVEYIIEGSVRRDADRVRITAQLIRVKDQTHVWAREYDRDMTNLLVMQGEIAQEIADEIQLALGERLRINATHRPHASTDSPSYEAYDLYLKGRYFWNKRTPEGFHQAAEYFQQAIAKDPNYARAYAGLADTYGLMSVWGQVPQNEFMPKARAAAVKALEIDETLAEAHTSLALIAENYYYDWPAAEKEFRRAIQLNPDYATAHQWYGEYLSWQGRFNEALEESERARQLDPLSLIIATDHGAILYFARQYDRAIAQFRAVLDMEPDFPRATGLLFNSYVEEGRFEEADTLIENERGYPAGNPVWYWSSKAYLYRRWDRTADTKHASAKIDQLALTSRSDREFATIYTSVGAGRNDQVIALLQKAYAEHSNAVTTLKVDPIYDPLRGDPRFQELLRKMGFVQ